MLTQAALSKLVQFNESDWTRIRDILHSSRWRTAIGRSLKVTGFAAGMRVVRIKDASTGSVLAQSEMIESEEESLAIYNKILDLIGQGKSQDTGGFFDDCEEQESAISGFLADCVDEEEFEFNFGDVPDDEYEFDFS